MTVRMEDGGEDVPGEKRKDRKEMMRLQKKGGGGSRSNEMND